MKFFVTGAGGHTGPEALDVSSDGGVEAKTCDVGLFEGGRVGEMNTPEQRDFIPRIPEDSETGECPCCGAHGAQLLLRTPPMPVSSCVLRWTEAESLNFPKRAMDLWSCQNCSFVWNESFDDADIAYGTDYESTQIHSDVFRRYLNSTAMSWLQGQDTPPRTILEVGCGQGEFLDLLSMQSDAALQGYDPSFRGGGSLSATIVPQPLPTTPTGHFDLVINRMTLEHVARPLEFLRNLAQWVAPGGTLITQVPNAERTISRGLICDLFYEHVNYFTTTSLVRALERAGFGQNRIEKSYGDQHLALFSARTFGSSGTAAPLSRIPENLLPVSLARFVAHWDRVLGERAASGREVWLWGTGSRATTFVSLLSRSNVLRGAIDINPEREGSYVLGSACRTHAPSAVKGRKNLSIIVMNPIYSAEISKALEDMSVDAELMLVEDV